MDDKSALRALQRVDKLRRELREAEANLKVELAAFSKRRNYGMTLREYQMRTQLGLEGVGVRVNA